MGRLDSWSRTCPLCAASIAEEALRREGEFVAVAQICPHCGKAFELYLVERPYQPVAPQSAAGGGSLSGSCAYHPNNQATAVCVRCGDFLCNLCLTAVEGKGYCPKCFELMYARGSLQSSQRAFRTPSAALGLGLVSLFCGWAQCLGLIVGPLGIYLGVRALADIKKRPELPGRSTAIAGIVVSALGTLVTLGVYLAIIIIAALGEVKN